VGLVEQVASIDHGEVYETIFRHADEVFARALRTLPPEKVDLLKSSEPYVMAPAGVVMCAVAVNSGADSFDQPTMLATFEMARPFFDAVWSFLGDGVANLKNAEKVWTAHIERRILLNVIILLDQRVVRCIAHDASDVGQGWTLFELNVDADSV